MNAVGMGPAGTLSAPLRTLGAPRNAPTTPEVVREAVTLTCVRVKWEAPVLDREMDADLTG